MTSVSVPLSLWAFLAFAFAGCTSLSGQSDLLNLSHLDERIVDLAGQETENIHDPLNLLKQGEAYGEKGDPLSAGDAYKRFLELYPFHRLASFARYALGVSYMRQITAVDRDPTPIDAAVDTFQKVLTDYPDTLYAVEAEKKITLLLPQLAEYQFRIGLFYERQATYPAAIARFQQALKKVAHGALAEKAIYHLGRSLAENGNREEAKQTFQRLMLEYPDSDYLRKDKIAL